MRKVSVWLAVCLLLLPVAAEAIDYKAWVPLLPRTLGGMRPSGEPDGMNMEISGQKWSSLSQDYASPHGDKSIELTIVGGKGAPQVQGFQMMPKIKMETEDEIVKTVTVSGYDAWFVLDKQDKVGTLIIPLKNDVLVNIEAQPISSEGELTQLAGQLPLAQFAANSGKDRKSTRDDGGGVGDRNCDLTCPAGTHCVRDGFLQWCENADGVNNGPLLLFDENGNKISEDYYVDGKLDGPTRNYHKDGSIELEGQHDDGEKQGTWTYYYPDGSKEKEETYVDDEPHGPFNAWYSNGQKYAKGQYKDGLADGYWTSWHKNGNKESKGGFHQDIPCGTWTYYNEEGTVDRVSEHDPCP